MHITMILCTHVYAKKGTGRSPAGLSWVSKTNHRAVYFQLLGVYVWNHTVTSKLRKTSSRVQRKYN